MELGALNCPVQTWTTISKRLYHSEEKHTIVLYKHGQPFQRGCTIQRRNTQLSCTNMDNHFKEVVPFRGETHNCPVQTWTTISKRLYHSEEKHTIVLYKHGQPFQRGCTIQRRNTQLSCTNMDNHFKEVVPFRGETHNCPVQTWTTRCRKGVAQV